MAFYNYWRWVSMWFCLPFACLISFYFIAFDPLQARYMALLSAPLSSVYLSWIVFAKFNLQRLAPSGTLVAKLKTLLPWAPLFILSGISFYIFLYGLYLLATTLILPLTGINALVVLGPILIIGGLALYNTAIIMILDYLTPDSGTRSIWSKATLVFTGCALSLLATIPVSAFFNYLGTSPQFLSIGMMIVFMFVTTICISFVMSLPLAFFMRKVYQAP